MRVNISYSIDVEEIPIEVEVEKIVEKTVESRKSKPSPTTRARRWPTLVGGNMFMYPVGQTYFSLINTEVLNLSVTSLDHLL